MKCPECMKEEKNSYVHGKGVSISTAIYNEDGILVSYRSGINKFNYNCSNNHVWESDK